MATQLQIAAGGRTSEQMRAVAKAESVDAAVIQMEIAAGRLVIPANAIHLQKSLKVRGIGRVLSTKVNANIGTSSVSSSVDEEIAKMESALDAGADAVMDLSTGENVDEVREELIGRCPVPFGTVPIYEVIQGRGVEDVNEKVFLEIVEKQAKQGVDFFTIHAGVLKEHLPLAAKRVGGIVSRGGALLAKWMVHHNRQNLLYEMFDDLCDIMAQYDVCFSLGDGLRPGAIADATDEAQLAELHVLGELTERAQQRGCQVMVEGPGHVPFNQIQFNMELQRDICKGAPFYVLGPLVTDVGAGYDHITSAIGGTAPAYYGASFLCYVTPKEHLGLPDADDVRAGVMASRIAAHAADIARGLPGAAERDMRVSKARAALDWKGHIESSLDPVTAGRMREEVCRKSRESMGADSDYCSMCGRQWCSIRTNREIREHYTSEIKAKS